MFARYRWIMCVRVMPIVMPVHVLVLDRLVNVAVTVTLADVQIDADRKQASRGKPEPAGSAIAE
jgi:hypothetical protein